MNIKQAYETLELSPNATPEEAKKRFRDLSKKLHPDVNKDPGAEDKFKKVNQAYQIISSGKDTDSIQYSDFRGNGIQDIFGGFGRQIREEENIELDMTISFEEAVFGCKKEIKYNRKTKCQNCGGLGKFAIHNGCDKCGGQGRIVNRQGDIVFAQTCNKCHGKKQMSSCKDCSTEGAVSADVSVNVSIPGGIENGNALRLGGMGHFMGSFGPMEQNTDVFLKLTVTPHEGLSIKNEDVISEINISLLEALQGTKKEIETVIDKREINIKPLSKNKDEIIIPKLGVNKKGSQRIIINIEYPKDIDQLIKVLQ